MDTVRIADVMAETGVEFGTSGARGRVADMTDRVCTAYTLAFVQHLREIGEFRAGTKVAVGGDLRPSTARIASVVARAVKAAGGVPVGCCALPSPALALFGLREGIPSVMVTGSHIPDDRNGIKFNRATGEILKEDEASIRAQAVSLPKRWFGLGGTLLPLSAAPFEDVEAAARELYEARYLKGFPPGCLTGLRVGLYEHSAVGRDVIGRVMEGLGARVTRLGRSEQFVPVDTEALRPEDVVLGRQWASSGAFDALVSSDGDSDRPLVADEAGKWLRGDVAGILTARLLGANEIVVPVSCNTAAERCGAFRKVRRTRIGSPYVIAEMLRAVSECPGVVVGYEANGGFLTATPISVGPSPLAPLPTRDALVVILSLLYLVAREGRPLSGLVGDLPARFTASDRLKAFPTARSRALLDAFTNGSAALQREALERAFGGRFGRAAGVDTIDGVRVTWDSGEIVHLRPSGNAPEFRCYVEADSEGRAGDILTRCLEVMEGWRQG